MRILVGLVLGFVSGIMIYFLAAMAFGAKDISPVFVGVTMFGGWAASTFAMVNGAQAVSKVFSRGFLIGAAEWLAVIPVSMIFGGMVMTESVSENASDAEMAGAALGAGLFGVLSSGLAIGMAFVCLMGFAISYFIGREMEPKGPTRVCPECAETIQAAARKCRFCGSQLTAARS